MSSSNGNHHRFLIVDDNPADVEIMELKLSDSGVPFTMDVCKDGEEALAYLAKAGVENAVPDLVLLDLKLPKRSGQDVLAQLRSRPETKDVPVIVLTSAAHQELAEVRASPHTVCIAKPFVLEDYAPVILTVKSILDRKTS